MLAELVESEGQSQQVIERFIGENTVFCFGLKYMSPDFETLSFIECVANSRHYLICIGLHSVGLFYAAHEQRFFAAEPWQI